MAAKPLKAHWIQFPYKEQAGACAGRALEHGWERLHRGDREPWPDARRVAAVHGRDAAARALVAAPASDAALAARLVEAWRAFHQGNFGEAWRAGNELGALGAVVACKAAGVYVTYLEDKKPRAEALLTEAVALAARAALAAPGLANAHYVHAFVLGRLSQRISVVKALAAGHATRVRASLERALKLEPRHADAHIALGLYHAEIVGKVGALAARLTYGASGEAAVRHFKEAIRLFPESAIAHMEYGNGLLAVYGDARRAEAVRLYERAASFEALDAMERLDVEQARAELD
jgi:tetratricopeptide (TPR) repeat protein